MDNTGALSHAAKYRKETREIELHDPPHRGGMSSTLNLDDYERRSATFIGISSI